MIRSNELGMHPKTCRALFALADGPDDDDYDEDEDEEQEGEDDEEEEDEEDGGEKWYLH